MAQVIFVSLLLCIRLTCLCRSACFVCGLCRNPLDGPFFGCGDQPFCESCIDEAEKLEARGQLRKHAAADDAVPVAAGAPAYVAPVKRADSPPVAPLEEAAAPASPPVKESGGDDHICHKCRRAILSGTVVNALQTTWHESCFTCNSCGCTLDAFYGHDSMPYCENCIDAAEEGNAPPPPQPATSAAPSLAIANAFKTAPAASEATASHAAASNPYGGSSSNISSGALPIPAAHLSWEERARVAEEHVKVLSEKLGMVKVALAEERRISSEEYAELQRELEREKERSELLERRLREQSTQGAAAASSSVSVAEVALLNESLQREQQRAKELEKQLQQAKAAAAQQRDDDRLSSALLQLEESQRVARDLGAKLHYTENQLEAARSAVGAADDSASIGGGGGGGGAPPPPPPPPGAPPPPPPMVMGGPLKITRTGQSAKTHEAGAADESNPQADLISELKKGRPMLRRAAAQRPSKRELLTKAANSRAAEQERPDPSVVKGADTANPSARKLASAAEKTAVLAVERDDRVKTGNLKMKVHRNKFLDQFLDQEFK